MMTVDTGAEAAGSFIVPVLVAGFGTAAVLGVSGVLMLVAIVVGVALIGSSITRQLNVHEATLGRVLGLPLFAGVSNAAVERALEQLVEVPMTPATSSSARATADRFYVIESGTVVVTQTDAAGATRELRRMGPTKSSGSSGCCPGRRAARRHGSDRRPAPCARRRGVPRPRRPPAGRAWAPD